ncbi:hypothetical protein FACS1894164_06000 [Spirochaetia bacterium]|nr:hypothetical protein FACS1894164_06000 [Spirochaetia bacterium]
MLIDCSAVMTFITKETEKDIVLKMTSGRVEMEDYDTIKRAGYWDNTAITGRKDDICFQYFTKC